MDQQRITVTPAEAALLRAIRADLKGDEIATLENITLRTFAVSALTQSVRAFLELSRTDKAVHIKGDGLDDSTEQSNNAPSWDDVTRFGDWDELYPGIELLTTYEAAELLGKSQPTVLSWIDKGELLALERKGRRGFRLPAEQFVDGKPILGIAEVARVIGHPGLAWRFLTTPLEFDGSDARPLDKLKSGKEKDMRLIIESARNFTSEFA